MTHYLNPEEQKKILRSQESGNENNHSGTLVFCSIIWFRRKSQVGVFAKRNSRVLLYNLVSSQVASRMFRKSSPDLYYTRTITTALLQPVTTLGFHTLPELGTLYPGFYYPRSTHPGLSNRSTSTALEKT